MTTRLDPLSYVRLPKLDVASAISLAKILLHRVPKDSSTAVRRAATTVEEAVAELETKWTLQVVPLSRNDVRPLASRLGTAWHAIRDRLVTYAALPESNADRRRAIAIHDLLFPDGLAFLQLAFTREHAESERRIRLIDERRLAKDIARLVGDRFLPALRAAHEAYGDALGITKASPVPAAPVVVVDLLRALVDAISSYALQLVALASHVPDKHDAIALALAPIDDFRTAAGRRASNAVDEEEPAANAPVEPDALATGTN
jgi:hypothetical protein